MNEVIRIRSAQDLNFRRHLRPSRSRLCLQHWRSTLPTSKPSQ
ncbi:Uncharacterised protein [Vibrio cholerae]|nr:Uncharacterised protein [Vibrio cholerae]